MPKRFLLAIYLFCVHTALAQNIKRFPVKAGEVPTQVLPVEAMYVLPEFTLGTATLKNKTSSIMRFNYNFLLNEMHFINEQGDTLAIAEPELISSVVIDSMLFYYDKGYLREIFKRGTYKLAVMQQMVELADKTSSGYGVSSSASSIKTYGSISSANSQVYHLQVKKDVVFEEVISLYIGDRSNHFLKANKKNFYAFFGEEKTSKYLKEHKVDFTKEKGLEGLLQFCAE